MKKFKRLKTEVYDNVSANLNEVKKLLAKTHSPYLILQSVAEVDEPFENSAIDFVNLDFKMDSDKPIEDDFYNAKMLYKKLRLTPQQATDRLFWTALAFEDGFRYINHRWNLNTVNNIKSRLLFNATGRRGLIFNALSSLWWFYHLTYNEELGDPEFYTKFILRNNAAMVNFFFRNFSASKNVRMAYFRFLYDYKQKYRTLNQSNVLYSVKSLSLLGGGQIIDSLSEEEIYQYLKSLEFNI